jgi:hypothetical protein
MQKEEHTDQGLSGPITIETYNLLLKQNSELRVENPYLRQELARLKLMIFGSKSERHIGSDSSRLNLGFDEETVEQSERND